MTYIFNTSYLITRSVMLMNSMASGLGLDQTDLASNCIVPGFVPVHFYLYYTIPTWTTNDFNNTEQCRASLKQLSF